MKRRDKALTEWALNEIRFNWGPGKPEVHNQQEFERLCRLMYSYSDVKAGTDHVPYASVPLLEEPIIDYWKELRRTGKSDDEIDGMMRAFFSPQNMLKYHSIYAVKQTLLKRLADLAASRGSQLPV